MDQSLKIDQNFKRDEYLIIVENLFKQYGNFEALKGVSFRIKENEIVGFLGLNGAGKTTTMNILTGCVSYLKGKVEICGFDVFNDSLKAKKHIGYLPENPPLYQNMTVYEYLKFVCELKNVKEVKKEVKRVVELCSLEEKKDKLILNLSKGFRQRVGIAQALVSNPKILILDEPTSGLDPAQIVQVRQLIRTLGREHTIIFSTHILSEIQAVCDRIIIVNNGKIVADNSEENLLKSRENVYFLRVFCSSKEKILEIFKECSEFLEIRKLEMFDSKTIILEVVVKKHLEDEEFFISNIFLKNDVAILEFKRDRLTLEQLFINLIEKNV